MTALQPLLRQHDFRALLGARLTNGLAFSALATVVGFQVYEITRDPLALGWLGLVEAIPALSLVLFGGHIADRRDRRSIILVTSALAVGCAVALALLSRDPALSLAPILGVIFVTGIASGFERPALSAFEAQVIPREQAVQGVSYQSSVSQAGAILGPALGGIAVALIGVAATYGLIATLLAVSTVCLWVIPRKPMPERVAGELVVESLLGGIRYVSRTPALIGSMALDLFAVFFGGAIALLPIFATDILHVGPIGLGLMRTAPSVGALGVMLIATRRPPSRHAGRTLLICVAGFGVSMIVFGLSTTFALSMFALFVSGVTDGLSMIIRSTILRVLSPERIRGRVASVNWVFIGASNELGAFESGFAARLFGTVPTVVAGGILTIGVVGAVALLVPSLRGLDLDTAEPTEDGLAVAVSGRESGLTGPGEVPDKELQGSRFSHQTLRNRPDDRTNRPAIRRSHVTTLAGKKEPMYDQITPLTPSGASAPTEPAAPLPVYEPAPVFASATPVATGQRRAVGPGFVLSAVLASALLASGGTYLAVNAAAEKAPAPTGDPGRQRREHRLRGDRQRLRRRHRQGRQPGRRDHRLRRDHLDRSADRPDPAGNGDRLRRHLRRQRPDPDQPPRRRR